MPLDPAPPKIHLHRPTDVLLVCVGCGARRSYPRSDVTVKKHYGHDTFRCNKCLAREKGLRGAAKRFGKALT